MPNETIKHISTNVFENWKLTTENQHLKLTLTLFTNGIIHDQLTIARKL